MDLIPDGFTELLLAEAKKHKKSVVVPSADNAEALEALAMAIEDGVVSGGILIGPTGAISAMADEVGLDLAAFRIVACDDDVESARQAARLVADGGADFLLKGRLGTKDYLKAVLDRELELVPEGRILTHVTVAGIPTYHKPLLFTDAAIVIAPGVDEKAQMVRNIADVARGIGVNTPKIAMIAAVEKVNPKMQATTDAAQIVQMAEAGEFPGTVVEGPYDLYIATSAESAAIKGVAGQVAGDADCLVFPDLNTANVFYKTLRFVPGSWNAGMVAGARVPILLPSRADTAATKRMSILVAAYLSSRLNKTDLA